MSKTHFSSLPFPSFSDSQMLSSSEPEEFPPTLNISPASSNAESERFMDIPPLLRTPSDKLSALPFFPPDLPPQTRRERTTSFAANLKRAYRRSHDGTLSLPTLPYADTDWVTLREHEPRQGGGSRTPAKRSPRREERASGKDTPRHRVSFDSDRHSLPAMPSVGQAISRITSRESEKKPEEYPKSRSPSQSRATSPLRMLHNWSSGFHRGRGHAEEPFIPVDPFKFKTRMSICGIGINKHDLETADGSFSSEAYDCEDVVPINSIRTFFADAGHFFGDTLPREIYLNILLRLPAMYFSRVARIFEDAEVSRPDIQRMIDNSGSWRRHQSQPPHVAAAPHPNDNANHAKKPAGFFPDDTTPAPGVTSGIGLVAQASIAPTASMMHMPLPFPDEWTPPVVSPALIRFKHSWEAFIDALLREWKTLNVVSALLASAILTLFQIPEAADDPLTRTFAFISLICALMSLSYGCIYIVRFGTMRSMFHASRWAEEARRMNTAIGWNVWVLLATPAVWMAWAMILFLSAILSFVWRTGAASDPDNRSPLDDRAALGPRVAITSILLLGMVYLAMIVKTLRRYGSTQVPVQNKGGPQSGAIESDRARDPAGREHSPGLAQTHKDMGLDSERRGRERERSRSRRQHQRDGETMEHVRQSR